MINFVTAIYNNSIHDVHGGRGRNINTYLASLRNIVNLGHKLTIYTNHDNLQTIETAMATIAQHDQFEVIEWELSRFEFYTEFMTFKESIMEGITLNDRNEVLCYTKPYWVIETIARDKWKSDKFVWIDSGLFHHGIIPERVGGVELQVKHPDSVYYPENKDNIFNPEFGLKLEDTIEDGFLFCCGQAFQGDTSKMQGLLNEMYGETFEIKVHIVAGIFGGDKIIFRQFFERYRQILEHFIRSKLHCLEEPVFSCIYSYLPNMFDVRKFDTWWYYSPGERCSYLTEEANSFYKIFTSINE